MMDKIVICFPTSWDVEISPGTQKRKCNNCGCDVWTSKEFLDESYICIPCFNEVTDVQVSLTKEQAETLKRRFQN